jgi:hypothetical protein
MIGRRNSWIASICSNHLSDLATVQQGGEQQGGGQSNLPTGKRIRVRNLLSRLQDGRPHAALPDVF